MTRMVSDLTRLGLFIVVNRLRPVDVARCAVVTPQYLRRLRFGQADPTRHTMARLTMACSLLLRRTVRPDELFDLTETGL